MDEVDTNRCVKVRIDGRVQGVGYRAWTLETARGLALTGWVRNCQDGGVEALFCGPRSAVEQMITKCQDGPSFARVTGIGTTHIPVQDFASFEILETE